MAAKVPDPVVLFLVMYAALFLATVFAGVSAGFGANVMPATTSDLLIGLPTKDFALAQGVPWLSRLGAPLNEATMDYFYTCSLVFVFTFLGGWVTNRFVAPKLEKVSWSVPEEMAGERFAVSREEVRDLKWAAVGLFAAACVIVPLGLWLLKGHFAKNVILFVSFAFFFCRRYRPQFTIGDLALMMTPYAGVFLAVATTVMLLWFKLGIPFGF